jgi:uncharacterized protein YqeY
MSLNLIEQIRKDKISALKNKDSAKSSLLSLVISEACKNDKNPPDETVFSTVGKLKNSIEQTLKILKDSDERIKVLQCELEILSLYVPAELTEEEIWDFMHKNKFANYPDCIRWFSKNCKGRFNPTVVKSSFENYEVFDTHYALNDDN